MGAFDTREMEMKMEISMVERDVERVAKAWSEVPSRAVRLCRNTAHVGRRRVC